MNPRSTRRQVLQWAAAAGLAGCKSAPVQGGAALVDDLERRTFDYFWETTDAATGLAPERWPSPSACSTAAVGFALTAVLVGVERRYVTRAAARVRVLATLRTLREAPQGAQGSGSAGLNGFFYSHLDMGSGTRFARSELSTLDTAQLLAGMLACQSFFDGTEPEEREIRTQVDELYGRVDWRWMQVRGPAIGRGWYPETGFTRTDWTGYGGAMIVYLLALGSPTKPVEPGAWLGWSGTYDQGSWGSDQEMEHLRWPALSGHQLSHCWVDFRGLRDEALRARGLDYFENSRRATLAQRRYAIANPGGWAGYGPDVWGLTGCDGPAEVERDFGGRRRRFAGNGARGMGAGDDGTVAPSGAGASIAFAPEAVLPALAAMKQRYGSALYGRYGFFDAFNPSFDFEDVKLAHGKVAPGLGWVDTDHLGVNQGRLLAMLGNHRGEVVWKAMRRNAHLRRGLQRADFKGGWLG